MKSTSLILASLLLAHAGAAGAAAAKPAQKPAPKAAPKAAAPVAHPKVALETTKGKIVLELDAEKAPKTVANFLSYVRSGHYNGVIFHRVIPDFMVQTGGFTAEMTEKGAKDPIANEADNGLKNERGTIAMARTNDPGSARAQFFINLIDNAFLNHKEKSVSGWGYAVFGKVIEGMEVVDAIGKVQTTNKGYFQDVPVEPITIKKATVLK